ncbi:MAG: hypothetical protein MUC87_20525 [Bacteroidia bacterium]|jgi:hypothetical protein|nr:hypothetical protein [Bacteroidia bacterium]
MNLLLLSLFLIPPSGLPQKEAVVNGTGVSTAHVQFTRFLSADVVKVKENAGQSLLVAHISCFNRQYRVVGQYNTCFIKAKRS